MAGGAPDPIGKTASGVPFKVGIDIVVGGFQGAPDATRLLLAAVARLQDTGPLMRVIARRVVLTQKQNILEQRAPDGTPWTPLKRSRGPGRNPGSTALFDTGRLYEAITYREISKEAVQIGTFDVPYAVFHQKGTRPYTIASKTPLSRLKSKTQDLKRLRFWGGSGWIFRRRVDHPGIPARPFVGIRPDDEAGIQSLTAAFAQAAFEGRAAA